MKLLKRINFFPILTFGLFSFLFFHFAKEMLQVRTDGWYVGHINLWGDLALHLAFINKFLESGKILVESPIFAGIGPNYPIFPDWITSLIARITGIDYALFITTLSMGIIIIFVARLFISNFIIKESVIFLALLIFFLNGGFGFFYFFEDYFTSQKTLLQFLGSLPREYTTIKDQGYWWINNFLAYFLPQRTTLFAFPMVLVIFHLLYTGTIQNKRSLFIIAGIAAGVLPLIQGHGLLIIFLICTFFFAALIFKKSNKNIIFNWLIFAAITLTVAMPIFRMISSIHNPWQFFRVEVGWMAQGENLILFWLKNLGLFAPVLIMSVVWIFKKDRRLFFLYLPFLSIFALANIFVFQPWNFDNSKIFLYWYFASSIVVAYFLYNQFFFGSFFGKFLGSCVVLIMTFSAILDIFRTFTPITNYQLYTSEDLKVAEQVKTLTPKDSVFITASNHNHPIPNLSGRSTILGFEGWVWSHGLDYSQRKTDIGQIYSGSADSEDLIRKYNISYITAGPNERTNFFVNETFLERFPKIAISQGWLIYDVSSVLQSDQQ